MWWLSNFKI